MGATSSIQIHNIPRDIIVLCTIYTLTGDLTRDMATIKSIADTCIALSAIIRPNIRHIQREQLAIMDRDATLVVTTHGMNYAYNQVLHRGNDQPAQIHNDGYRGWYRRGKLHRDNDLSAAMLPGVFEVWYQHGAIHRDNDQPAVIAHGDHTLWFQHGHTHRDSDQPAELHSNGLYKWRKMGILHRDNDQPAVIYPCGIREWYVNGVLVRTGPPSYD